MPPPNDDHTQLALALHRIDHLEKGHASNEAKIKELEKKLGYYDRMALKWGSLCIGFVSFGALASMGFDRLKEKLLHLIMSW